MVVRTYIPTNRTQGFPFLHILSNTCDFCLFGYRNSDRQNVLSQLCFNFHLPGSNAVVCVCVHAQSCLNLCEPKDCSLQAPLSMQFSRKKILEWDAMVSDDISVSVGHLSLFLLWKSVHLVHLGIFNWFSCFFFFQVKLYGFFVYFRYYPLIDILFANKCAF